MAAKTNEFWPIATGRRASRLQLDRNARRAADTRPRAARARATSATARIAERPALALGLAGRPRRRRSAQDASSSMSSPRRPPRGGGGLTRTRRPHAAGRVPAGAARSRAARRRLVRGPHAERTWARRRSRARCTHACRRPRLRAEDRATASRSRSRGTCTVIWASFSGCGWWSCGWYPRRASRSGSRAASLSASPDERVGQADLLDDSLPPRHVSTRSPSRSGWENAIRRPAMKFPIVRCAAKPTTIPSTAEEARIPPAIARTCGITSSAERTPTKMIAVDRAAAQDAVARDRLRARGRAGRTGGRRACATTSVAIRTRPEHAHALPERHEPCSSRDGEGFACPRSPPRGRARRRSRPRRPASRAGSPRRSRGGRESRPGRASSVLHEHAQARRDRVDAARDRLGARAGAPPPARAVACGSSPPPFPAICEASVGAAWRSPRQGAPVPDQLLGERARSRPAARWPRSGVK